MTVSTAPWVAVYSDIWSSRKLQQLRRALGITPEQAVGHLLHLWHSCLTRAPTSGELAGWTSLDLADAAGWPEDDADAWGLALVESRWLLEIDGGFVLHEWGGYGGSYLKSREDARARKKKSRGVTAGHGDVTVTSAPVPVTSQTTGPDLTGPNRTGPEKTTPKPGNRFASRLPHEQEVWRDTPEESMALTLSSLSLFIPTAGSHATLGAYMAARWPAYDGKQGRPSLLEHFRAKWDPFERAFFSKGPKNAYAALFVWMADGYHRTLGAWQRDGNVDPASLQSPSAPAVRYRPIPTGDADV